MQLLNGCFLVLSESDHEEDDNEDRKKKLPRNMQLDRRTRYTVYHHADHTARYCACSGCRSGEQRRAFMVVVRHRAALVL